MKKKGFRVILCVSIIVSGFFGYRAWVKSTEKMLGKPDVSPDARFEIRRYQVSTLYYMLSSSRGSDEDEGYVRLFERRSNKLIGEAFCWSLNAIAISWNEGRVGFNGPEGVVWNLPD